MPLWRLCLLAQPIEAEPPKWHFQAKPGNEINIEKLRGVGGFAPSYYLGNLIGFMVGGA
jgi:hypothetical protein